MTAVPQRPTYQPLSGLVVGRNVSSQHRRHLAEELLRLLAGFGIVATTHYLSAASGHTGTVNLWFKFPPGCFAGFVELEMRAATATAALSGVTITISGSTPTWISTPTDPRDGAGSVSRSSVYRWFFDSAGYGGSALTMQIAWADSDTSNGTGSTGLRRITVGGIPLADATPNDSGAGELGISPGSFAAGAAIIEGTAASGVGEVRALQQLEQARLYGQVRHLFQWSTYESTGDALNTTSTTLTALKFGAQNQPVFRVRPRRIYDTGTPNVYQVRIRENTTNLATGTLRVAVTPVGGSVTNTDLTWTGSGAWAAQTLGAVNIPCSGTGQECDVSFEWKTSSGTARLSSIVLWENET